MTLLERDHWNDNILDRLDDAEQRVAQLERLALVRASDEDEIELGVSVDLDAGQDYRIDDQTVALGRVISAHQAIPGLVSLWPMSVIRRESGTSRVRDVSGAGNHLNDNNVVSFRYDGLVPVADFGGTNQYLSLASGAGGWANLRGTEGQIPAALRGATIGGWFYFDAAASAQEVLIGKRASAGNYSYWLERTSGGNALFAVSTDGTATVTVTASGYGAIGADTWVYIIGRFDPSAELSIEVNTVRNVNTSSIPASIYNGTADFAIGAAATPGAYFDGKASMCWPSQMLVDDDLLVALYQQSRSLYV